jgi:hypothetical protein
MCHAPLEVYAAPVSSHWSGRYHLTFPQGDPGKGAGVIRSAASKVMWVGRATVFMVGLAVILALVLGVATTALGATEGNFILEASLS